MLNTHVLSEQDQRNCLIHTVETLYLHCYIGTTQGIHSKILLVVPNPYSKETKRKTRVLTQKYHKSLPRTNQVSQCRPRIHGQHSRRRARHERIILNPGTGEYLIEPRHGEAIAIRKQQGYHFVRMAVQPGLDRAQEGLQGSGVLEKTGCMA